ncbi:sugar phosphate isomerase/epimerase [Phototrophicus methaneseepsis]|uniref:Sugar phosphate isomerase/epimerase n=1 Tax=Phototrophicus methaneseepsis TaxID=2710758 RepID=A0A7S8IEY2_9CHLR|nr:sugar phosphate isomerase/epimerase [Phototrophicus methaneseepsis]QPC84150.1 sugar phosphate isomerase/epimerase [Phototrophicus methaneseepsis]
MPAPIALQLYTVREALKADLEGTITKIAEMGYIGAESYGGLDAAAVKKAADAVGLQIMGTHASPPVGDQKDAILEMARTYGVDHIVVPGLDRNLFQSRDGLQKICDLMNEANENAKSAGIKLGYHNHEHEFAPLDGSTPYQIMLDCMSKDIFLELDTYWAQVGGQDVNEMLDTLGQRVPFLHIKDGPGGAHDNPQFALGEGIMDVPGIINNHAADWLIVELDSCATDMMEAVQKSYTYLIHNGLARGNR